MMGIERDDATREYMRVVMARAVTNMVIKILLGIRNRWMFRKLIVALLDLVGMMDRDVAIAEVVVVVLITTLIQSD